jgi:hypothetical protein
MSVPTKYKKQTGPYKVLKNQSGPCKYCKKAIRSLLVLEKCNRVHVFLGLALSRSRQPSPWTEAAAPACCCCCSPALLRAAASPHRHCCYPPLLLQLHAGTTPHCRCYPPPLLATAAATALWPVLAGALRREDKRRRKKELTCGFHMSVNDQINSQQTV